jgi:YVTN family beta-propeller protein
VVDTINVGTDPLGAAFNPNNKDMYVTNGGPAFTVSVIDTSTNMVVDTIDLGNGNEPYDIAFDPNHGYMYVTDISVNHVVSVIDTSTNKVIDTIPVGHTPEGVAFNPMNKHMYVTNGADNTVSVISTCEHCKSSKPDKEHIQIGYYS